MRRFNLLVFDWDGTLMDSEARIVACLESAIADLDLPRLERSALRNIIGLGLAEACAALYPEGEPDLHGRLIERYRHHFLTANPTPSALFDGARETLEALSDAGYLLAVATGKGRQGLDKVLAETGLKRLFHATRCADETLSKPNPRMLLELMDVLGTDPAETLMIGDTEYDLMMARNGGVAGLAVSYGVHSRERLLQCEPLGFIHDIGELNDWLLTHGRVRPAAQPQ